MYVISDYSKMKAIQLNVTIKPSTKKYKKIDVFKNNILISSIGDNRYSDYPSYIKSHGKTYADKRKKLYNIRHAKDRNINGTSGYYAAKILW